MRLEVGETVWGGWAPNRLGLMNGPSRWAPGMLGSSGSRLACTAATPSRALMTVSHGLVMVVG